MMFRILNEMIL